MYHPGMTNPLPTAARRARRFDSLEQEAFLNLWRTYDRLRAAEDALFGEHDLTPQQYNVLRLLRGVYPDTLPTLALAARLVSRAPDITRMLDKLEQRSLIAPRAAGRQSPPYGNDWAHTRGARAAGPARRIGARLS